MSGTTDFELWLEENEPDTDEELYALHEAVDNITDETVYSVTQSGEKYFVKGPAGMLVLASEKARSAFLRHLNSLKSDKELDWDSWIGYRRAMNNPKA